MQKTALVTGFTGQDGTFLTKYLLGKGYKVVGLVRRVSTEPPHRVRGKFDFSQEIASGQLVLEVGDLLSRASLDTIIFKHQPDEIYNLAAQSHVGISFKQPEFSIEADFMGVVNLIESLISVLGGPGDPWPKKWRMYQASTSEMFGDRPAGTALDEDSGFAPNSPYSIAKAAAHFYCRMKRQQGFFISNGILFNHESEIRGGDFVTQKIVRGIREMVVNDGPALRLGNLNSRRDWGYAGDYVIAMWAMLQQDEPDEFCVGTGETHSIREFVEAAFKYIGKEVKWNGEGEFEIGTCDGNIVVKVDPEFYRPNDVNFLLANATKAKEKLGWSPAHDFEVLVGVMLKAALDD